MAKPKTYEEATEQVNALKEKVKEARIELREFKAEHKLKGAKVPEDEKLAAKLEKLNANLDAAREAVTEAKAVEKELKPRKARKTIYEYPEGMSDADKKKFRAKKRREKRKAEKAAEEGEDKAPAKKKPPKKKPAASEEEED